MVERLEHQLEYLQAIQASAWIEKLQDASPTTSNEFVAWLKQSPQNIREFLLALSIEEALGLKASLSLTGRGEHTLLTLEIANFDQLDAVVDRLTRR